MDVTASNAETFGITYEQSARHAEIMRTPIRDWDASLRAFVEGEITQLGYSGDVMAQAVADWIVAQDEQS